MLSYFGGRSSVEDDGRESAMSSYDYDDEEFEMLVKAFMQDIHYTTVNQAAMNIACSMVNTGLVALPFVAQEAGIPLFVFTMLLLSIISGYTSIMVVSMANEKRVRTLEDLAECAFGIRGFFIVSILQLVFSLSLMIITLNVWADILSDVFRNTTNNNKFLHEKHYQIYFGAAIILPLCILKKSMSTLRWTSFVTILAIAGAFIAVIATYVSDQEMSGNYSDTTIQELCRPKGYWWAIVFISVYSFSSNQKVLTIYSSLRRRTADRWQIAMRRALTVIFLLYTLFGICGYIAKDRRDLLVDGFNFFLSDAHETPAVFDPARCLVAFSLLLTLPVDNLVAATTWRRLWAKMIKRKYQQHASVAGGSSHNAADDIEMTCCAVFCSAPNHLSFSHYSHNSDDMLTQTNNQSSNNDHDNEQKLSGSHSDEPAGDINPPSSPIKSPSGRRKMYNRRPSRHNSRHSRSQVSQALSQPGDTSSSSLVSGILQSLFSSNANNLNDNSAANNSHHSNRNVLYTSVEQQDTDDTPVKNKLFQEKDSITEIRGRDVEVEEVEEVVSEQDRETLKTRYSSVYNHDNDKDTFDGRNESHDTHNTSYNSQSSHNYLNNNNNRNNSNQNVNRNNSGSGGTVYNIRNHSVILLPKDDDNDHDNAEDTSATHSFFFSGDNMYNPFHNTTQNHTHNAFLEGTSPLPERQQVVPTLCLWLITIVISLFVKDWTYLVGSLGTLSTILLLFIIPSMLYFRLRLVSDYEAIPIVGALLPNHLYMGVLLVLGVCILLFDILVDAYYYASGERIFDQ